jgi:hypothetical protein
MARDGRPLGNLRVLATVYLRSLVPVGRGSQLCRQLLLQSLISLGVRWQA